MCHHHRRRHRHHYSYCVCCFRIVKALLTNLYRHIHVGDGIIVMAFVLMGDFNDLRYAMDNSHHGSVNSLCELHIA